MTDKSTLETRKPDVLAKQVTTAASDMCEIARIVDEWRHGPKQSLTAIREIRAVVASPSPTSAGVDAVAVKAAAKKLREKHGSNGWDLIVAEQRRDRSAGEKREFWQAVCDRINSTKVGKIPHVGPSLTPAPMPVESEWKTLCDALECAVRDLSATYDAAKTGKPVEISLGQFMRLRSMRELVEKSHGLSCHAARS